MEHLSATGFRIDGGAIDWLVEHPDPETESGEEFEDDPHLAISQHFDVTDGLLLVDAYPMLAGGGAPDPALAGPEVVATA